jgi:hypothetical protein
MRISKDVKSAIPASRPFALITLSRDYYSLSVLIFLILAFLLTGCGPTRYEASEIYPVCEKPFEECSIDLSEYKPALQRIGGQDPNLSLAVAISGGGHRAANFAAGVLLELERIPTDPSGTNILQEIDYFSTVSGGGFAAAAYISSLHDYMTFKGTDEGYSFAGALEVPSCDCPVEEQLAAEQFMDPCIRRHLRGFYSNAVNDLIQDIISWLTLDLSENAGYFEKITDDDILGYNWRKRKLRSLQDPAEQKASLTLADIFIPKSDPNGQVKLPYWIANATVYENGAIFAFTPRHLKLYKVYGYRHRLKIYKHNTSQPGYEQFINQMPLSVAATASANFPAATFPTTLISELDPNNPYLHLYDGGMADNIGVVTAARVLQAEPAEQVTKKVLLVIDAYRGTFAPFSSTKHPPPIGNTAIRAMNISLDSWRGRYREITRGLCKEKGIEAVFLSFDDLSNLPDCNELVVFGLSAEDVKKLKEKAGSVRPFELLRAIKTIDLEQKGKLSSCEQNLLLAAGRYAARTKKTEILTAIGR